MGTWLTTGRLYRAPPATIQTPLHHHMNIVESDKGGNQIAISKISVRVWVHQIVGLGLVGVARRSKGWGIDTDWMIYPDNVLLSRLWVACCPASGSPHNQTKYRQWPSRKYFPSDNSSSILPSLQNLRISYQTWLNYMVYIVSVWTWWQDYYLYWGDTWRVTRDRWPDISWRLVTGLTIVSGHEASSSKQLNIKLKTLHIHNFLVTMCS